MADRGLVTADAIIAALEHVGIETDRTRRVVIDLKVGDIPVVYTEQYGDQRLLSVVQTLKGVEIRREAEPDEVSDG